MNGLPRLPGVSSSVHNLVKSEGREWPRSARVQPRRKNDVRPGIPVRSSSIITCRGVMVYAQLAHSLIFAKWYCGSLATEYGEGPTVTASMSICDGQVTRWMDRWTDTVDGSMCTCMEGWDGIGLGHSMAWHGVVTVDGRPVNRSVSSFTYSFIYLTIYFLTSAPSISSTRLCSP